MSLREDDLDRAARNVRLDEAAIEESYLLASGPGGQNVNKVSGGRGAVRRR
jgi:protein subunit release factor B